MQPAFQGDRFSQFKRDMGMVATNLIDTATNYTGDAPHTALSAFLTTESGSGYVLAVRDEGEPTELVILAKELHQKIQATLQTDKAKDLILTRVIVSDGRAGQIVDATALTFTVLLDGGFQETFPREAVRPDARVNLARDVNKMIEALLAKHYSQPIGEAEIQTLTFCMQKAIRDHNYKFREQEDRKHEQT